MSQRWAKCTDRTRRASRESEPETLFLEILWKWQVNEIMRFKDASVKIVSGSAVWMANSSYMSQMQDAGDRHKLLMLIIQKIEKSENQNPRRNSSEDSDNTRDHENSNLTIKNNKKLNKETVKKRLL